MMLWQHNHSIFFLHLQNERMIGVQVSVKADHSIYFFLQLKIFKKGDIKKWKQITSQPTQPGQQ